MNSQLAKFRVAYVLLTQNIVTDHDCLLFDLKGKLLSEVSLGLQYIPEFSLGHDHHS